MTQATSSSQKVLVFDFGAQYGQLIARRVRDLNVYSEIVPCDITADEVREMAPSAIILSGGPASVNAEDAPRVDPAIYELGVPVLGFCYGHQITAVTLGGSVFHPEVGEYGAAELHVNGGALFEGTPAEKAGLLPNDIIKKIDGKDMVGKPLSEISSTIKEYAGKTFAISIERDGKMTDVNVVPGEIETVQVSGKMLDGGISYIRISMFEGHCTEQLKTALDNAKNSGAKGIIFDVRNNPGGALDIITNCVDQILDEGIILTVRDKNGKENVYKAKDKEKIDLPIVILTNAQTASAAEVFTSSLHDNGKAYTVGTKTYGKGVVQTIFDLGDKSIAKITTAKYFTPKNVCIDKIGLEPDKKVELDEKYKKMSVKYIPDGEDAQLITAVEVMKEKIK